MTTPTYKLTYFNTKARGEPIRLIFAYAGVSYEDVRIESKDWPEIKTTHQLPWGQLPILEVDGKVLAQSHAIVRYLGKQFNMAGADDFESAKCDEIVESVGDLGKASRAMFFETDPQKKKEITQKLLEETFANFYGKWNKILLQNGGYFVGGKMSYADLVVVSFLELYNDNIPEFRKLFEKFPALKKHQDDVLTAPRVAEWVSKRPKTQW